MQNTQKTNSSIFRFLSPQYLLWHISFAFVLAIALPLIFGPSIQFFIDWMQMPKDLFTLVVKVLAPIIAFSALYTGILKSLRSGSKKSFFNSVAFYLLMCAVAVVIAFPIGYLASEHIDANGIRLLIEGNLNSSAAQAMPSKPESTFEKLSHSTILWAVFLAVIFAFVTDSKYRQAELDSNSTDEKLKEDSIKSLKSADTFVAFFEWLKSNTIQVLFLVVAFLSPWAIIGALGSVTSKYGPEVIWAYKDIIFLVFFALFCQSVFLMVITAAIARVNPFKVLSMSKATLMLALSTSSSKACLPVAMAEVEKMGVGRRFVDYQIALGSSINMDGTAIYMGVISFIFSYTWLGYHIDIGSMVQLIFACTIFAIGAAGIPSGSLVFLTTIFPMVGVPAAAIFAVQPIDAILDRGRTVLNIWGDITGAIIRASSEGELDRRVLTGKQHLQKAESLTPLESLESNSTSVTTLEKTI